MRNSEEELNYPKGETLQLSYYNSSHKLLFIITTNASQTYSLYRFVDGKFERFAKGSSPIKLEEQYLDSIKKK